MDPFKNLINNAAPQNIYGNFINISTTRKTSNLTKDVSVPIVKKSEFKDEFAKETKKQGLFEKAYNFLKNKTGFGIGSNQVNKTIDNYEKGQATEENVKKSIGDYKNSQKNAEQNLGDLTSSAVVISGYFKLLNMGKVLKAKFGLKENKSIWGYNRILQDTISSKTKMTIMALPLLMIAGGFTKWATLKLNRIKSEEFKVENKQKLNKDELKKAKKSLNHKRHMANFKNFGTGMINGLLSPITAVYGGIVGVPAYVIANSGIRFLTNKNNNNDNSKSFSNYIDILKNNAALNTVLALGIAAPALKKARYSTVLSENLEKVVKKLKSVELVKPDLPSSKTAYSELEEIMLKSPNIEKITSSFDLSVDEKIKKLTEENIFAVKFIQISIFGDIASALIENCPPSRTLKQAQQHINTLMNSDKYKVSKLLGVGTVAESYLAKDNSGKEVCIKILKEGIDAQKIEKDKKAFINMVTEGQPKENLTKSQQYLVKNIENLAESISKEVDFENEFQAAQKLRKHTKKANVVVPIEAKKGIYIMEKAPGISLDTLVKYYEYERNLKRAKSESSDMVWIFEKDIEGQVKKSEAIEYYNNKINELKSKSPDFNDFDLSPKEINLLLKSYIDVLVEQFTKIEKNGKTVHADIHPGNIFINLEALKTKKGKLFTLIDTGNTLDLTKEQALSALKLTSYVKNGNVNDLTESVLDGAVLPPGMPKEEAVKLVKNELKLIFFDYKTQVYKKGKDEYFETFSNFGSQIDKFLALTNNILRKYDIIPSDTQLTLNKAKKSANNSLHQLKESFFNKKYEDKMDEFHKSGKIGKGLFLSKVVKDYGLIEAKEHSATKIQETLNLLQLPFNEMIRQIRNPNMLKTNSEKHLTYILKQNKVDPNLVGYEE